MESPELYTSIDVSELQSLLASPEESVIVIDVRQADEYERLHIPFAVNIPVQELANRIDELQAATKIITACGSGGNRCKIGAATLRELGFTAVAFLNGGTKAWHEAQE